MKHTLIRVLAALASLLLCCAYAVQLMTGADDNVLSDDVNIDAFDRSADGQKTALPYVCLLASI